MLKVGKKYIITPIYEITLELQKQLEINKIPKLYKIRNGRENIQVCCPIHKNGKETRPSCGIAIVDTEKVNIGTVNCFACNYSANFPKFVSDCFGKNDEGKYGERWLLSNFDSGYLEEALDFPTFEKKNKLEKKFVSKRILNKYRKYHPYLEKRGIGKEIAKKFDVGYDKKMKCITFPVLDKKGNCLFIARRSIKTKFFNYPEDIDKPIYGINFITSKIDSVIVCESIINCLTCWQYGSPAVALIGLGKDSQIKELRKLPVKRIILGLDSDEAGYSARNRIMKKLKGCGKLITYLDIPDNKDINDLSESEFSALNQYI